MTHAIPVAAGRWKSEGEGGWSPTPDTRQALIDGLNHDLAGEYQAVLMYTHYAARVTGPTSRDLRALFRAAAADELGHAQFLADKVTALGGEPTTEPGLVPDAGRPRAMLEHARAAESRAIADYGVRARQAEAAGDIGLRVGLENQLADECRHKEELERFLVGWGDDGIDQSRSEDRRRDDGGHA
jgi:bacterioferritin